MKNRLSFLVLMLAAAGLNGCSKDEAAPGTGTASAKITQTFYVEDPAQPEGAGPDSRTVVNSNGTITFTASETMSSHIWAVVNGVVTKSTDGATATRTAGNPPTITTQYTKITDATDYHFVFVSPAGNGKVADPATYTALNIKLGSTQRPTTASFDPAQDVLVSKPIVARPAADPAELQSVEFKRMFTFFKMTLDRNIVTQLPTGEPILSVSITANDPAVTLSGDATVPITDNPAECVPAFTTSYNSVLADYGDGADFTDNKFDVWLVVNPTTFTGMRIKIRTATKVITQTLDSFVCDLRPGKINTLDFQWVNNDRVTTTIADYTDYYKDGVTIDGVTYNSQSQDAKLLAAGTAINPSAGGVLFLDTSAETPATAPGIVKDLVIIGRYSDEPASLPMQTYWALRNASGKLIFKNVDLDFTPVTANYCFNFTSGGSTIGGMKTLCFENCSITLDRTLMTLYGAAQTVGVENIVFRNCKLRYEGTANSNFITTSKTTEQGLDVFKTLVFENNIIYSTANTNGALIYCLFCQETASTTGSLANLAITCTNNTFINVTGFGSGRNGAYFTADKIGSVTFSKNILYSERDDKYPAVMAIFYDYNNNGPWPSIDLQRNENKAFNTSGWKLFNDAAKMYAPSDLNPNTYQKITGTPFTTYDLQNGKFVVDAAYAGYGSTLQ